MKTNFTRSNKDNLATATLVAVSLFVAASGLFSNPAVASHAAPAVQKMDTIVVTASRVPATLETIIVTASRKTHQA